jgi:hypothetical protein
MYQEVLGAATPVVAGVAVLPNTGSNSVFKFAAYAAITIGVAALVMQLAAGIYRLSTRSTK